MNMPSFLILVSCLALSGCATMSSEDCRSTDWYRLGERDGETGPSLIDDYSAQCAAHGVRPDAARYSEGQKSGAWWKEHLRF
jgi:hypothetical protein